jgi:hypothetical protein
VTKIVRQMTAAMKTAQKRVAAGLPICPVTPNTEAVGRATAEREHGELDYFVRALPELLALERYERRAVSRRKRAIQMFNALQTMALALRS